jgi:hypothetical protein
MRDGLIEKIKRFEWNDVEFPEGSVGVGRIWRMLMLEECRLRFFGNPDPEWRSGLIGRRRGGAIAPEPTVESIAPLLTDFPAAAQGPVV